MNIFEKLKHFESLVESLPDVRKVMVEGDSGILACSPPHFKPDWQPGNQCLVWPNGSIAEVYGAENPDKLRGPQHHFAWADELAAHIDGSIVELLWLVGGRRVQFPPYLNFMHLAYLDPVVAFSALFLHLKSQFGVRNDTIFNAFHKFRELVKNGVIPRQNDSE